MKYSLLGLLGVMGITIGFISTNNLSEIAGNSIEKTIGVMQSPNTELNNCCAEWPYHWPRCTGGC